MKTRLSMPDVEKDNIPVDVDSFLSRADKTYLKKLQRKYSKAENELDFLKMLSEAELRTLADIQRRTIEKAGLDIDGKTGRISTEVKSG